ncbi:MAG TPA: hypothetical protein VF017_03835 [Thermoanaerobaculia bacterium]|nr:hypothetical protein [Thermoanaerobaculia bacterium]
MNDYKRWYNVATGSHFHYQVTGADTHAIQCAIDALRVACAPFPQPLSSPNRYKWFLEVRLGNSPARVEAWITRPDGTPHGDRFDETAGGAPGEIFIFNFRALTQ